MVGSGESATIRCAGHALDAANVFLADVRDGLGPYLAMLTEQKWNEASIGIVISLARVGARADRWGHSPRIISSIDP